MADVRTIPLAVPATGDEEWLALRDCLETGWLTQGPKVQAFEVAFASRHRVRHALATTSCTTALHLALSACGIGPGDEVLVPAFTWVATANAVVYCGARPVLVDVLPDRFTIDPAVMAAAVTERTVAAIPVHLFGLCADMDAIRAALPERVAVIEDAACAAGAAYLGTPAGAMGRAGCFSFHPRKSITTGEGGMVTTDDADLAAMVESLRNHGASLSEAQRTQGMRPHLMPDFDRLGFNSRMTDLQAAMGVVQLGKLDRFIDERDRLAMLYREALADVSWLRPPEAPEGYRHAWQSFVTVLTDDAPVARDRLMDRLLRRGVHTRPGTHAVPELGYYRTEHGVRPEDFPVAVKLARRSMALPLHNRMNKSDVLYVVESLKAALDDPD